MSNWTEERIEYLKNRWDTEASATVIAAEMEISRCAVLGKVHRLGLRARAGIRMTEEDRKASEARSAANRKPKLAGTIRVRKRNWDMAEHPIETSPFAGMLNIPFADLRPFSTHGPNQCRYVAAEPPGPLYPACGNETVPGASYCPHCGPRMRANYTNTPAERAESIRLGTRNYLRAQRRAAA